MATSISKVCLLFGILYFLDQNQATLNKRNASSRMSGPGQHIQRINNLDTSFKESWHQHTQHLGLVFLNTQDHVRIYFGANNIENAFHTYKWYKTHPKGHWLFNFTSDVWRYMQNTYGPLGEDSYLNLVLHNYTHSDEQVYTGVYIGFSNNPPDSDNDNQNILDISAPHGNSWETSATQFTEMNLILNKLAYFVEYSSSKVYGSPSRPIWDAQIFEDPAWVHIFTYDVYTNLKMGDYSERYRETHYNYSRTSSKHPQQIFWFKDWFLPIYNVSGGHTVLSRYFKLLSNSTQQLSTYNHGTLDLGGFVHFWSAAAEMDLAHVANETFCWNQTFQIQLVNAREHFKNLANNYRYNNTPPVHYCLATTNTTTPSSLLTTPKTEIDLSSAFFNPSPHDSTTNAAIESTQSITIGITVTIILVLIIVLLASFLFFKKQIQSLQMEIRALSNEEVKEFFDGDPNINPEDAQALVLSMPFIKDFEIPREKLIIDKTKVLGTGEFGSVLHGLVQLKENNQLKPVAMKTVKKNVDVITFKGFLSEVKIMAYLGTHENIVKLLGTCTSNIQNLEIFIALEFCSLGSLESYLKTNRNNFEYIETTCSGSTQICCANSLVTDNDDIKLAREQAVSTNNITFLNLLKWSQEISNAMMYLTQKKVIHGDLAARNVLLTETRVAKISDFGLSRQFLNYSNYTKTSQLPVPWRWLAIECLKDRKFSTASDVWAFGVTLWEIFSLAETPFGLWTFDLFFVDKLISGDRLLKPTHANDCLYQLMKDCWEVEPTKRPKFDQIHSQLAELILETLAKPTALENDNSSSVIIPGFETVTIESQV